MLKSCKMSCLEIHINVSYGLEPMTYEQVVQYLNHLTIATELYLLLSGISCYRHSFNGCNRLFFCASYACEMSFGCLSVCLQHLNVESFANNCEQLKQI